MLVASDRTVLDSQFADAVFDFGRTAGVVATIKGESSSKSGELAEALAGGKKIVVCTIQTFPLTSLTESGGGSVQEKEKARLAEILSRVNDLFEGELTEDDRLVYVNNVIKGKFLESVTLVQQAANKTKEQFASSPDLSSELLNAIMDALAAHTTMSTQALASDRVRSGLRDVLLGPAQLYEALRARAEAAQT